MRNKTLLISLLLLVLLIPKSVLAKEFDFIDVKIGDYTNGSKVHIKSKGGLGIYDRKDKILYKDLEIYEGTVIIRENELGDIVDQDGDYVCSIDLKTGVIGSITGVPIYINNVEYRGCLGFVYNKGGKLLSHLPIEYYLCGVLPREMGGAFPLESLKAQAVASRSYAMVNINKHKNEGYNLCNTTHCQVYGGVSGEHPATNKAVEETKGVYLRYNGNIAEGLFHSNNGGYMESAKDVWGGDVPYLVSKRDEFSDGTINSSWTLKFKEEDLGNRLKNAGIQVGELIDVKILEKTSGKRVKQLEVIGSRGSEIITSSKFRNIIGANELKSTLFEINREDGSLPSVSDKISVETSRGLEMKELEGAYVIGERGMDRIQSYKPRVVTSSGLEEIIFKEKETLGSGDYIISGRGFGHGVGMSQYGAKKMAELGYSYVDILRHYYEGIEIY